ncbi:MAG TPA: DinB family protein [Gemmatimonadaceae bacterium]|nr:DinB family protein [Gemmatimonadaceae bacterium]
MKTSHAALALALTLAAAVGAQQASANPMTAGFKARITGLHHNIAQAFDSIPESKFGYRPTPAQLSIGYIAQHVASDNYYFCNNFGDQKAQLSSEESSTPDSVKATWPKAKLVEQLAASFKFCEDAMGQLDDAKLADQVQLSFNGQTRNVTRSNFVLGHALDLADHYSQLANYMRLNGIIPPTALPRRGRGMH